MALLDEVDHETGAALVTITHDLAVAALAGRRHRLDSGRLTPLDGAGWNAELSALTASRPARVVAVTGLLGVVAEAWGEVRVHKSRVVLSLIGVFLAVLAMTTVTALGQMSAQVAAGADRAGRRPPRPRWPQPYDPATGMPPGGPPVGSRGRRPAGAVRDHRVRHRSSTTWACTGCPAGRRDPDDPVSPSYGPTAPDRAGPGPLVPRGRPAEPLPGAGGQRGLPGPAGRSVTSTEPPTVVLGGPQPVARHDRRRHRRRLPPADGLPGRPVRAGRRRRRRWPSRSRTGRRRSSCGCPRREADAVVAAVRATCRCSARRWRSQAYRQDSPGLAGLPEHAAAGGPRRGRCGAVPRRPRRASTSG